MNMCFHGVLPLCLTDARPIRPENQSDSERGGGKAYEAVGPFSFLALWFASDIGGSSCE